MAITVLQMQEELQGLLEKERRRFGVSDKDAIYRQDAIDAINAYLGLSAVSRTIQNMTSIQEILEKLPSAESKIIHCKDCKHRDSNDCPMYYEEWIEIDEGDGYFDTDTIIHDWTTDEGFCHFAESRGEEE